MKELARNFRVLNDTGINIYFVDRNGFSFSEYNIIRTNANNSIFCFTKKEALQILKERKKRHPNATSYLKVE